MSDSSGKLRVQDVARVADPTDRTFASPAGSGAPADSVRIADDRGDTLRLAEPASRVVSLIPAATEILFAIGAGERVVGRTRYGDHPPAARSVPSVGEGVRPSAELVLARRPDAVIMYAGSANQRSLARFSRVGVPVLAVEHNTLGDLYRNLRRLGALTGRRAEADSLVRRLRRELSRVRKLTGPRDRPAVYYDVWSRPPRTVGSGSYLDTLIAVAGGRNVFSDLDAPSPQVSLEAVAARDPDLILAPRAGGSEGRRRPPAKRPGWDVIPAVREGRVRRVDGDLLHRLGPRLGRAAAELAAAVHPELEDELRARGLLSPARRPPDG